MVDAQLSQKVRIVEGHTCDILYVHKNIVDKFVVDGIFVGIRRAFRRYLTVDAASPESKAFLRSTARIEAERFKHLRLYRNTIHPYSRARFHWESLMIVVYFWSLTLIPFTIILPRIPDCILYPFFFLNIISLVDVVIWFYSGYFDPKTQRIELKLKKIAVHYILRFFIVDFISSVPFGFILQTQGLIVQDQFVTQLAKLRWFTLLKITRIFTLNLYVKKLYNRLNFKIITLKITTFAIFMYFIILWSCAFKTMILENERNSSVQRMYERFKNVMGYLVLRYHRLMKELVLVGYQRGDQLSIHDNVIMIAHVIFLIFGFVFYVVIIVKVTHMYNMKSSSGSKYNRLIQQITEYMRYKELPPLLRDKIFTYINFKFQKHTYKESDILKTISTALRQDILLHNCKTLVEKVDFFKDLPDSVMLRIIVKLRTEVYLRNDIIFKAGSVGSSMYFIYLGIVAIYTPNGLEICHLHEGDNFGEIALFVNKSRTANVVAVTECEVFKLSRKDLLDALEPFPEVIDRIKALAMRRLKSTTRIVLGQFLDTQSTHTQDSRSATDY